MILTGPEIRRQIGLGAIVIEPFDEHNLNPNSYNYRLGDTYKVVSPVGRDRPDENNDLMSIPDSGLLLEPGRLYLGHTYESIGSRHFVTSLIGRSSVGRLGLFLQISADLGNLGPAHCWTLELTCVQRTVVYPFMQIGQVSFWQPEGAIIEYQGRYTEYSLPKEAIRGSLP